jgi:hypothetical protein
VDIDITQICFLSEKVTVELVSDRVYLFLSLMCGYVCFIGLE